MDRSADNLGQIINDIQRELEELKTTQLRVRETFYPVGSIYMSATATTTSEVEAMFGGTWEAFGKGKTLVGVDPEDEDFAEAELTGGSKTHRHSYRISYTEYYGAIPALSLRPYDYSTSGYATPTDSGSTKTYTKNSSFSTGTNSSANKFYTATAKTGTNTELPPYITCYMFRRVA